MRSIRILQRLTAKPLSQFANPRFIQTFNRTTQKTQPHSLDSFAMAMSLTISGGLSGYFLRDMLTNHQSNLKKTQEAQDAGKARRP